MKFSKFVFGIIFFTLTIYSTASYSSLIVNGSFEDNDVPYGKWRWFNADEVNGWSGSNIEIWDHLGGERAYHGSQFAELNAHPRPRNAFSIYQDFQTVAGQAYYLSFAYQARSYSTNEAFLWEILDLNLTEPSVLTSLVIDDHAAGGWSTFNSSFVAISNSSRIKFTTLIPSVYTQGNLLDDIRITRQVSEPSTFLLICLGLWYLMSSRSLEN